MANFTRWPSIRLTMADRERLERLANASMHRYPATADYLAHEIERARIVEPKDASEDLVTMGSSVEFRDDVTGRYAVSFWCIQTKPTSPPVGFPC